MSVHIFLGQPWWWSMCSCKWGINCSVICIGFYWYSIYESRNLQMYLPLMTKVDSSINKCLVNSCYSTSEHKACTKQCQLTWFPAVALTWLQAFPNISASPSIILLYLPSLPVLCCPCPHYGKGIIPQCMSNPLPLLQFDMHYHTFLVCIPWKLIPILQCVFFWRGTLM